MSGDVEAVKTASRQLRGHLADELTRPDEPFDDQSAVLLKFHGIYQQDDRDVRRQRAAQRQPLAYSCMVRAAVPGGRLQPDQWRAIDRVADLTGGSLRLTTRQGVQFHATPKAELQPLISALNAELVTTLGACGDVVRNTMACPLPHADGRERVLGPAVAAIAAHFRPRTSAYWEIWMDGEAAVSAHPSTDGPPAASSTEEPIYGEAYLPRKFKIGLAWPGDNCIDVHGHDVGLVPTLTDGDRGELTGWTILVGGGLGMSHAREEDTYPRLASPVGWVEPERLIPAIEAVVTMQRDHGERVDRQRNRLKYLVDDRGLDWVRGQIEDRLGAPISDAPELLPWVDHDEHHGWSPTDAGDWVLGLPIPSGRLRDEDGCTPRQLVRGLLDDGLIREVRVSARQDLLLTGIETARRDEVVQRVRAAGLKLAEEVTPLQRLAIACPALPTCGQALGEAERVLPALVDGVDKAFADGGVGGTAVRLNMTGCPNGCARPYNAEIGVVGRTKRTYDVYVGGTAAGDRLGFRLRADVALDDIPALLAPVAERYGLERTDGETFGDFCHRLGVADLETVLPEPTVRRRRRA